MNLKDNIIRKHFPHKHACTQFQTHSIGSVDCSLKVPFVAKLKLIHCSHDLFTANQLLCSNVSSKYSKYVSRNAKNTSFYYFKYDIPHASDNLATLGAVYKHRVIWVNRLSQVLIHRDKFRSVRTAAPAIVLKIVLYQCHT